MALHLLGTELVDAGLRALGRRKGLVGGLLRMLRSRHRGVGRGLGPHDAFLRGAPAKKRGGGRKCKQ